MKTVGWIVILGLLLLCVGTVTVIDTVTSRDFKDLLGMEDAVSDNSRAEQTPLLIVRVGALQQEATTSWNTLQLLRSQEAGIVITPASSFEDAKKKSSLIEAIIVAKEAQQEEYHRLERACNLLKGKTPFIREYPPATRVACP